MKSKTEVANTLLQLIQDVGIPAAINSDGAQELQHGKWNQVRSDYGIPQTITEPYSPWQNRAEINIREAKKRISRLMQRTHTPKTLWDYCANYIAEITCLIPNDLYGAHGRTPHEIVTGNTPDITEYVEFGWFDPIYYYDDTPFPDPKCAIGRWLGVAHRVGQALCYWVLTITGSVIARTTIQKMSNDELISQSKELLTFDAKTLESLSSNDNCRYEVTTTGEDLDAQDLYHDTNMNMVTEGGMPDIDDFPGDAYDNYINAQVMLPRGDTYEQATVIRRKRDNDGYLIGHKNENPILDTRVYEVSFTDGHVGEYTTNVIAKNIFSTVDDQGHDILLFHDIVDHHWDKMVIITQWE
jgi:hypothetical protein